MKTTPSSEGRDPLDGALREWRVAGELSPRFKEQVWRRIAAEENRERELAWWPRIRSVLEILSARPAFATACVLAFMLAGTAAGWVQGRRDVARLDDTLGWRYVQSIDPYLNHRH